MAGREKGLQAMASTPDGAGPSLVYNMSQSPPSFSPIRARKNDGLSSSPGSEAEGADESGGAAGSSAGQDPVARKLLVDEAAEDEDEEAASPAGAAAPAPRGAGGAGGFPGVQVLGGSRSPESEDEEEDEAALAAPAAAGLPPGEDRMEVDEAAVPPVDKEPSALAEVIRMYREQDEEDRNEDSTQPAAAAEEALRAVPTAARAGGGSASSPTAASAECGPSQAAAAAAERASQQSRRCSAPPRLGRGMLKEQPDEDMGGEDDADEQEGDGKRFIIPPSLAATAMEDETPGDDDEEGGFIMPPAFGRQPAAAQVGASAGGQEATPATRPEPEAKRRKTAADRRAGEQEARRRPTTGAACEEAAPEHPKGSARASAPRAERAASTQEPRPRPTTGGACEEAAPEQPKGSARANAPRAERAASTQEARRRPASGEAGEETATGQPKGSARASAPRAERAASIQEAARGPAPEAGARGTEGGAQAAQGKRGRPPRSGAARALDSAADVQEAAREPAPEAGARGTEGGAQAAKGKRGRPPRSGAARALDSAADVQAPMEAIGRGDGGAEAAQGQRGRSSRSGAASTAEIADCAQESTLVPFELAPPGDAAMEEAPEGAEGTDAAALGAQLVPVEPTRGAADRDSWGSDLPPEAADGWTVTNGVCSLKIGPSVLKLPKAVHDRLYGYQRQGVAWMWNLFHKEFGGILADEMGLGKTVQCAALLACLKFTEQGSRFLIVAPVTLLEQWRRELLAWANDTGLAVHLLHGSQHERRVALQGFSKRGGAIIVSYDMVRNGIAYLVTAGLTSATASLPQKRRRQDKRSVRDDDSPSEGEEPAPAPAERGTEDHAAPWDVVIVDEGHQIKNPSCQVGKALRKLKARCRFLLTGTPLQNKLSDLWALMDFVQPSLLGNHATFEKSFSEQIAKGSKRNASRFEVELKDHLARELKRLTGPHFLRRMKSEVSTPTPQDPEEPLNLPQELPPKTDVVLWLKLTQAQEELYNLFLNTDLVRLASGSGKCGMEALRAIALLKKLCSHPMLCLPQDEFQEWKEKVVPSGAAAAASQASQAAAAAASQASQEEGGIDESLESTQPAPECQHVMPRLRALVPNSVQGAALLSCKLRVLSVLLPQLQKRGHRCLIFSQSTRVLDLIQACVLRVLGLKFLRIDGTIEAKDRDLKLNKFQQPGSRYFCMCLSVQTGGTGLTITGADRVILVDPAWNPSADAQAIDRVHRIGQQKDVVVYRLIAAGAIEDKMFRVQVFKRGVSKTYLEQEQQVRFFSHKELKTLFEPPSQSSSTQSLMAEQIGTEALEHEELLRVVASDIGSTDDPDALPFWQSSDVLGFSDYTRLFMFLEQACEGEEDAVQQAKAMAENLRNEQYIKDQVVENKWRKHWIEAQKGECEGDEGAAGSEAMPAPLQDA